MFKDINHAVLTSANMTKCYIWGSFIIYEVGKVSSGGRGRRILDASRNEARNFGHVAMGWWNFGCVARVAKGGNVFFNVSKTEFFIFCGYFFGHF